MHLVELSSLLDKQRILLNSSAKTIHEVIDEMAGVFIHAVLGEVNEAGIREALLARESTYPTAVGYGCAIPHAPVAGLTTPLGCIIITRNGVPFGALDAKPVRLFFGLIIPPSMCAEHVRLLRPALSLLMRAGFRETILQASSKADILRIIRDQSGT